MHAHSGLPLAESQLGGVVLDAALFSLNVSVLSSSWISPDAMMMGLCQYSVLKEVVVELLEVNGLAISWRRACSRR